MKILVEIDLPNVDPNDIYKPNSLWFNKQGYIDIDCCFLEQCPSIDEDTCFRFKYIGQVQEGIPRP